MRSLREGSQMSFGELGIGHRQKFLLEFPLGGRIANDQSPGRGRGGSALLDGVGQLVREDEVPRKRTGPILAGSEADMLPIRERPGSKPPRKSRGPVVRVDLDATETMAQAPLHPGPDVSVEGLAGAELE